MLVTFSQIQDFDIFVFPEKNEIVEFLTKLKDLKLKIQN